MRLSAILTLAPLWACSDAGLKVYNADPSAAILSPDDGSVVDAVVSLEGGLDHRFAHCCQAALLTDALYGRLERGLAGLAS